MIRIRSIAVLAAWLAVAVPWAAHAQSQAANGNIEGIVRDTSGAVIPGVTVTVTNVNTGTIRVVVTNESGLYRAVALPLGRATNGPRTFREPGTRHGPGNPPLPHGSPASTEIPFCPGTITRRPTVNRPGVRTSGM